MRYVAFVILGLVLSFIVQFIFGYLWAEMGGTAGPAMLALALPAFLLGFLAAWAVTIRTKRPPGKVAGMLLGAISGMVVFFVLISLPGAIPSTRSPVSLVPLYAIVVVPISLAAGYLSSLRTGPPREFIGGFLGALAVGVLLGLGIAIF